MNYLAFMGGASLRLKNARERAGYQSAKSAAEAMNVPVATYIQHENGARGFPADRAARYGRFFRVPPEWLLYGKNPTDKLTTLGPQLFVIGEVAAGLFREAWKLPEDEWVAYTGRADVAAPLQKRFGLSVAGIDYDEVSSACRDFVDAKDKFHHPESEAGRDLGPNETAELCSKVVRLRGRA